METLNQALTRAAGYADCGLRLLDRGQRETWLGWADIRLRAARVAAGLQRLGVEPGETVGLFFPTGREFFFAFFGVLLAGAVPVPLYPPVRLGRLPEYLASTARMLRAARIRRVLADTRLQRILGEALRAADTRCHGLAEISGHDTLAIEVDPDALGLVQFSSGTTMDPKPVALTHRALMAQTTILNSFWPDTEQTTHSGVSWLPLYHDMGLIGCVFTVLERPSTLTLIPPELFVAKPAVWLRALSRYGATISPAPNFAFGLCTEKIRDEDLEGVDLRSWSVALCGAETVVPEVLERFAERFARVGFRREALTPVYGLSEAALAVTFSAIDRPFVDRWVSRPAAGSRRLSVSSTRRTKGPGRRMVSVGRPLPGFEIEVREPSGDERVGDGVEGRIWVRGPSLMREYLHQPAETERTIREGWLNTGDLGFEQDGELFVTGRAKDVLIVRGANHSPEEIEAAVSDLPEVRTGCAAAVGHLPDGASGEQVWLFVERPRGAPDSDDAETVEHCRHQVLAHVGVDLDHVEVLEPGTLPRTSSGKIRRQKTLELYLADELEPPAKVTPLSILRAMGRSTWARWRPGKASDAG